jgi:hypothetical protein
MAEFLDWAAILKRLRDDFGGNLLISWCCSAKYKFVNGLAESTREILTP